MNGGGASAAHGTIDASVSPELEETHPETPVHYLLRVLEAEYAPLIVRLTASLRSSDAATDALHDAYLKLGNGPAIGEIRHPLSYLYRMAINLAKNRRRGEARFTAIEADVIDSLPDEAPGPEQTIGAQHDMALALSALSSLPARRRGIFLACWRDDKTQAQIALDFRLHKRTVQKELMRAERHLRATLGREKQRKV